jgi:SAM-dependent methyltransferase
MNTFKNKIEERLISYGKESLTDKSDGHSYEFVYPELLSVYENVKDFKLLEVGTWRGHSLSLWSELFPNGIIYGSDIDYSPLEIDVEKYDNIVLLPTGSQDQKETYKDLPQVDFIIDDASHQKDLTIETFYILKDYLKPGGTYVIEDVNDWSNGGEYPEKFLSFFERIDLRDKKNRSDDVVLIYKK